MSISICFFFSSFNLPYTERGISFLHLGDLISIYAKEETKFLVRTENKGLLYQFKSIDYCIMSIVGGGVLKFDRQSF